MQIGAAFVGTSGNSDTSSAGADVALHRRWAVWQIESGAAAVRSSSNDVRTAERYLGLFRGQRRLTSFAGLSSGVKLERDRFSGMDFRSIADVGVTWALLRQAAWTLDGTTGVAWNAERPTVGPDRNNPIGLLQLLSRVPIDTGAHRAEFEVAGQAAMNSRLALKLGYLVRRSNAPVPGFKKTDAMTTASVVMQWKAATPAP